MSKEDIINELAQRIYGNTNENEILQCTQFCDILEGIITDALIENKKVLWKGFMSVEVVERGERRGRHPQTNEVVVFPPSKSIKCKMSKAVKEMIQ